MSASVTSVEEPRRTAGRAILWGGLACGVLDITSAVIISIANGGSPVRMLQGIAGALLGPVSFEYGAVTAALGLAMHFGVAFTAAAVFYWLSRRIPAMVDARPHDVRGIADRAGGSPLRAMAARESTSSSASLRRRGSSQNRIRVSVIR